MRISEISDVTIVDIDGEPGFSFVSKPEGRGRAIPVLVTVAKLNELVEMLTFEGCGALRDYEYELAGAVKAGADRRRRVRA